MLDIFIEKSFTRQSSRHLVFYNQKIYNAVNGKKVLYYLTMDHVYVFSCSCSCLQKQTQFHKHQISWTTFTFKSYHTLSRWRQLKVVYYSYIFQKCQSIMLLFDWIVKGRLSTSIYCSKAKWICIIEQKK